MINNKKMLSTMVYYTLAILALASAGFFIFAVIVKALPVWAKVIYYIWTGFVIGAVIFDAICTYTKDSKTVSGYIIYVLSILSIGMTVILYIINATRKGIVLDFFNTYLSISIISIMTSGYLIAMWAVGQHLIKDSTSKSQADKNK